MIDFSKRVTSQEMQEELAKKEDTNAIRLLAIRSDYPNIDLTTATLTSLSEWLTAERAKEQQGNFEHYLPFHDVVVPVSLDTGDYAVRFSYGGNDYAVSAEGLRIATPSGWRLVNSE